VALLVFLGVVVLRRAPFQSKLAVRRGQGSFSTVRTLKGVFVKNSNQFIFIYCYVPSCVICVVGGRGMSRLGGQGGLSV
jgi:hypothetical protein